MSNESTSDREICEPAGADGVQGLLPGIMPGAEVVVRGAEWLVDAVVPHEDCTALHLQHRGTGHPRVLLWPFDRVVRREHTPRLRVVTLRQFWRRMTLALHDVRVDGLRARALGARVVASQLAPALAVANGASRVLLADEVGLGKTVQAGWIVADAGERRPDSRVLIAVPAGLRRQWQAELAAHFGLDAILADAAWLRRAFSNLPADVTPWSLPGIYITSIDFLKRADVLHSVASHTWDTLVVDEAHSAAAPTDRYAALQRIASRARVVVLITATPFSGDGAAFASLMRLGTSTNDAPLIFRRSREDVGLARARRHRFTAVTITAAERRLQRLLERYTREVWISSHDEGARLAMTVLRKRALSSPKALARSLDRRIALLNARPAVPCQMPLFDDELTDDDDEPSAALAAPGLEDPRREHRWLARLAAAAHAAPDSKERYVRRLLHRLRGEPAIVFTEYRDTLHRLSDHFRGALVLHGAMTAAERAAAQARFNADGGLLFATDAASEGLNLQHRCRLVVSYELPWNPARLEQRIGRVDRIGQARRVHAITLVARDTAEDLVIANFARRLGRVAATLGERDRLAAYLTEARTAGIVVGGMRDSRLDAAAPPAIAIEPAVEPRAEAEAARLEARARAVFAPTWRDSDVLVSSLRARPTLERGYVLVFEWSAVAGGGPTIDRHTWTLHVDAAVPKHRRAAADARALAARAISEHEPDARARLATVAAQRLAMVAGVHAGIIARAIAREAELRDRDTAVQAVQPGLFDRRAVILTGAPAAEREGDRADHDRRMAALAGEQIIESHLRLAAVLIVHAGDAA